MLGCNTGDFSASGRIDDAWEVDPLDDSERMERVDADAGQAK